MKRCLWREIRWDKTGNNATEIWHKGWLDSWMFNPHGVVYGMVYDKKGFPRKLSDHDIRVIPPWYKRIFRGEL